MLPIINVRLAGFEEVLIILHPEDSFTQEYYVDQMKNNGTWGIDIQFSRQYVSPGRDKPSGTADAVLQVFQQNGSWQTGKVIVLNSDNLY